MRQRVWAGRAVAVVATAVVGAGAALGAAGAPAQSLPVVNPTIPADLKVQPIVLTGASFPDWAAPANQTVKLPLTDIYNCQVQHPSDPTNTDNCAHNGYAKPELDTGTYQGQLPIQGTPTNQLLGYRWDGRRFVQIPFQVDKMFTRYLDNSASGFGIYSGDDQHTTYQYDREGFRYTKSDPSNPCLAVPDSPAAKDPIQGLDTNDELAFMASDAGAQAPAGTPLPAGIEGAKEVAVRDPSNPSMAPVYAYVMKASADGPKPAYDASNGYVRYVRDPNADYFAYSESKYSNYGNAPTGIVCDDSGHPTTAPGGAKTARHRIRDFATVTTPRYRFRYDGRWLMTGINISSANDWAYGPNIVDRWKARAFQQDPSSKTPCCGFEEEDTHWGGSSVTLGERVGPVRAIRETWGADSGTNVIRRETFYRDQVRMKTWLRVHVIPPLDGIYAQWDMAAGRVKTYYNPSVPGGVQIDGRNDTVFGNLDDPCNADYDANKVTRPADNPLGTGLSIPGVGTYDPNQIYRQVYQQAKLCTSGYPYHQSINLPDPTFESANASLQWNETAGANGTMVDRYQLDQATDVTPGGLPQSLVAAPYYRDDSCFDDGTGGDPGPRLKPGESSEPKTAADGTLRRCWTPADGVPAPGDSHFFQGDIATHGLHLLFQLDSDNARQTVPVDEIVSENRMVMLPGEQGNVGETYGREFEKPPVALVAPFTGASAAPPPAPLSGGPAPPDNAHSGQGNDQGGDQAVARSAPGQGVSGAVSSGAVSAANPLGLAANGHCLPAAGYRLALRPPRGQRLVSVSAYVGGRLVAHARGRRVSSIALGTLIQASQVVRIVARTDRGHLVTTLRSYRGCLPTRPAGRAGHRPARRIHRHRHR